MLRIRDIITGNVSDSPADRAAEPFVFVLGLPIILPCAAVYLSYKGVKYVGEKIVDRIETKKYNKEIESTESITTSDTTVKEVKPSKPKRLVLKREELNEDNKKM